MRHCDTPSYSPPTSRRALLFALCGWLCAVQLSCGFEDEASFGDFPLDGVGGPFTLWNRSQYTLQSVHIHSDPYVYDETSNLIDAPLTTQAQAELRLEVADHVTVIRQRVNNGARVALTTSRGLAFPSEHGVLVVFDDGFLILSREEARQVNGFVDTPLPEAPDAGNDADDTLDLDASDDEGADIPADEPDDADIADSGDLDGDASPLDAGPDAPLDVSPDDAETDDAEMNDAVEEQ